MTNAMCASLMHTTFAQAPCAASSCADMHAILGIIILDIIILRIIIPLRIIVPLTAVIPVSVILLYTIPLLYIILCSVSCIRIILISIVLRLIVLCRSF